MAGREGFEPPEARTSTVFKTAAFDHSAISRNLKQTYPNIHHKHFDKVANIWRRHPDSNWGIKALQAHALPLGYVATIGAIRWCPRPDLNRYRRNVRGILSPLCLPISPPGHNPKNSIKTKMLKMIENLMKKWSGKRGSNPRPQPWQGCALPLSYSRESQK